MKEYKFNVTYAKVEDMNTRKYKRTLYMGTNKPLSLNKPFIEEENLLDNIYRENLFPVLVVYEDTKGHKEMYEFLKEKVNLESIQG
jgi:hypothetical protein